MMRSFIVAGLIAATQISSAQTDDPFVTPGVTPDTDFVWTRNVTPLSTYAFWDFFDSPLGPNAPLEEFVGGALPMDAPIFDAFDANAENGSGTFITSGGNIYSFSGVNTPLTISPGYDLGYGFKTTILFQTRTLGSVPDNESFLVNGRREPLEVIEVDADVVMGPFGGADTVTSALFQFARNDLEHAVFFSAAGTSMSFDVGIIDTFVEPMDCPPDLDLNDTLDVFDLLTFMEDIEAMDGDWNDDDATTVADIVDYIAAIETGCGG